MLKTICSAIIVVSLVGFISTIIIAIITKIVRRFRSAHKGDNDNG